MPSLSILIPAWNEAPLIADAVRCAQAIGEEVIVVDGGSPDGTADITRTAGATVLQAPKGRGPQLRAGAAAAAGDVLLVLHADARLPALARDAILGALADPEVIGGNFLNRFLPESWFTRILEPVNDRRRRRTRRYYGDSGIFVRRAVHERLGGFAPYPIMHDYAFSAAMERAGRCVYVREPCLYASARRFQGRELRTALAWLAIQSLFPRGVSPHRLARAYPDVRGGDPERFMALCRERLAAAGRAGRVVVEPSGG